MLTPHGYGVMTSAGVEPDLEVDSVQCAHCGGHVFVKAGAMTVEADESLQQLPLGWCGRCGAVVCGRCNARGTCDPFEAQLARAEARSRLLRDVEAVGRP